MVVRLKKVIRDGEREIAILTSLPQTVASATDVAELYREHPNFVKGEKYDTVPLLF